MGICNNSGKIQKVGVYMCCFVKITGLFFVLLCVCVFHVREILVGGEQKPNVIKNYNNNIQLKKNKFLGTFLFVCCKVEYIYRYLKTVGFCVIAANIYNRERVKERKIRERESLTIFSPSKKENFPVAPRRLNFVYLYIY